MAGHLLATVNKEASDAIESPSGEMIRPGIGSLVVYTTRQGAGRSGRNQFPALVSQERENGTFDLIVIYGPDDLGDEIFVGASGGAEPFHTWHWPVQQGGQVFAQPGGDAVQVAHELAKFKQEIGEALFGEYEKPPESLLDIFSKFEDRFIALERKVSEMLGEPPGE